MTEFAVPGTQDLTVSVVRSSRAKRLSLRVSRLDGRARLTVPRGCSDRTAKAFLADRADWLLGHMANVPDAATVRFGAQIPFRGEDHTVQMGQGRRVHVADGVLWVPKGDDMVAPRVAAFLKATARLDLHRATSHYADKLGRGFHKITLRDTRSRWGSCSSLGNLNYSWRLIMAPPAVLDYVAAHEVAHLQEMNHSPAFWSLVEGMCPDYRRHRAWLRTHGHSLHRYQFG